jgi:hypothetical protein
VRVARLAGNRFGDSGMAALAAALLSSLTTLFLRCTATRACCYFLWLGLGLAQRLLVGSSGRALRRAATRSDVGGGGLEGWRGSEGCATWQLLNTWTPTRPRAIPPQMPKLCPATPSRTSVSLRYMTSWLSFNNFAMRARDSNSSSSRLLHGSQTTRSETPA